VGLSLLIFLTVTLGVGATFQLLSGLLFPDSSRVRRRVAGEFGKSGAGERPSSPLFKNLDLLSVDMKSGGMSDLGMAEMPRKAPRPTAQRL
jgi:hypothetical protein